MTIKLPAEELERTQQAFQRIRRLSRPSRPMAFWFCQMAHDGQPRFLLGRPSQPRVRRASTRPLRQSARNKVFICEGLVWRDLSTHTVQFRVLRGSYQQRRFLLTMRVFGRQVGVKLGQVVVGPLEETEQEAALPFLSAVAKQEDTTEAAERTRDVVRASGGRVGPSVADWAAFLASREQFHREIGGRLEQLDSRFVEADTARDGRAEWVVRVESNEAPARKTAALLGLRAAVQAVGLTTGHASSAALEVRRRLEGDLEHLELAEKLFIDHESEVEAEARTTEQLLGRIESRLWEAETRAERWARESERQQAFCNEELRSAREAVVGSAGSRPSLGDERAKANELRGISAAMVSRIDVLRGQRSVVRQSLRRAGRPQTERHKAIVVAAQVRLDGLSARIEELRSKRAAVRQALEQAEQDWMGADVALLKELSGRAGERVKELEGRRDEAEKTLGAELENGAQKLEALQRAKVELAEALKAYVGEEREGAEEGLGDFIVSAGAALFTGEAVPGPPAVPAPVRGSDSSVRALGAAAAQRLTDLRAERDGLRAQLNDNPEDAEAIQAAARDVHARGRQARQELTLLSRMRRQLPEGVSTGRSIARRPMDTSWREALGTLGDALDGAGVREGFGGAEEQLEHWQGLEDAVDTQSAVVRLTEARTRARERSPELRKGIERVQGLVARLDLAWCSGMDVEALAEALQADSSSCPAALRRDLAVCQEVFREVDVLAANGVHGSMLLDLVRAIPAWLHPARLQELDELLLLRGQVLGSDGAEENRSRLRAIEACKRTGVPLDSQVAVDACNVLVVDSGCLRLDADSPNDQAHQTVARLGAAAARLSPLASLLAKVSRSPRAVDASTTEQLRLWLKAAALEDLVPLVEQALAVIALRHEDPPSDGFAVRAMARIHAAAQGDVAALVEVAEAAPVYASMWLRAHAVESASAARLLVQGGGLLGEREAREVLRGPLTGEALAAWDWLGVGSVAERA